MGGVYKGQPGFLSQPWPEKVAYGCAFLNMERKITAIEPQKKNPERVNIYLDGKFTIGVNGILAAWLKVGQSLNEAKLNELMEADGIESAYQKALHFISYRPRSIAEVRKNLAARDIPEDLIDETIQRLKNNSVLNDLNFAREWVTNRKDLQPRSRLALRMELRQKGIADEVIQQVLDEIVDDDALALLAAKKYSYRLEGLDLSEFRKKLYAYLSRKGFNFSSINPVLTSVWSDLHPTDNHGSINFREGY